MRSDIKEVGVWLRGYDNARYVWVFEGLLFAISEEITRK